LSQQAYAKYPSIQFRHLPAARLYQLITALLFICTLLLHTTNSSELGTPIIGEAKTAFLNTWGKRLQRMHSLHMVFTQEKHLRLLRQPLVTRGELWLKDEILYYVLKNTLNQPEFQLRMDSHTVKTYYPLLQTLEVIELTTIQSLPISIPFLGRDPEALAKTYGIEVFATAEQYTLHLTPRDPTSPVRAIHLSLKDFQPQRFSQSEKNGNRLDMHIATFTPNLTLDASQLALHIPAGTTVTHPLK
jgi:outer membrane lipoprotein-sorting protein